MSAAGSPRPLLLTHAAQLLTLAGPARARRGAELAEIGVVADGALLLAGARVLRAGPTDVVARDLPRELGPIEERDCRGMLVTPGLVDAHTHAVFAGPRLQDYESRLAGRTYQEIAAAGGGIQRSLAGVRAAAEDELTGSVARWLRAARRHGATTVEVKSGYGLETGAERKSLRAAARAAAAVGLEAPRTFLGAHIVPPGAGRAAYVEEVCERMLPAVMADAEARPEFADVFCDPAGFTPAESRAVLGAAQRQGLGLKLHAEQFAHSGGCGLGIEMGAVSVDHLDAVTAADAALLGRAATVATLLPGASLFLGLAWPPARMLVEAGAAVALATDFNPGTCPMVSLPLVMSLGCSGLRLSPAECWTAVTINAAAALARAGACGSLQPGKRADAAVFACDDYRAVPYFAGANLCRAVVQRGEWIEDHGPD